MLIGFDTSQVLTFNIAITAADGFKDCWQDLAQMIA